MEPDSLDALDWDHWPACELSHGARTFTGIQVTGACEEPAEHYAQIACTARHLRRTEPRWFYVCAEHYVRLITDDGQMVSSCGHPLRVVAARRL